MYITIFSDRHIVNPTLRNRMDNVKHLYIQNKSQAKGVG